MIELTPPALDTDGPVDVEALKSAYGCFPSGVIALCAKVADGTPIGIAVSSFTSVSMDPPLVSVCISNTSETGPHLAGRTLGLSILGSEHGMVCRQLARKTGNRFEDVGWAQTAAGAVLLEGAAAWMECTEFARFPAGDHYILVLRVTGLHIHDDVDPLVFHASTFAVLQQAGKA
jgi:flavin reductase (DIM6/NTAB) family NADH-FMN oxidoreductase RutF